MKAAFTLMIITEKYFLIVEFIGITIIISWGLRMTARDSRVKQNFEVLWRAPEYWRIFTNIAKKSWLGKSNWLQKLPRLCHDQIDEWNTLHPNNI